MRLVVETANLSRVLSFVGGCIPQKSTIPVLQHVLVCASGSTLTVRATNLEREAEASCPAQMDDGVLFTLPGAMFSGIVSSLAPGSQVSFEHTDNNGILMSSGRSKYTLRTLGPEAFPSLAVGLGDDHATFNLSGKVLAELLSVVYASEDSIVARPELYGVRFHVDAGVLYATSSDMKRIGRRSIPCPKGAEDMIPPLVPIEGARVLAGVAKGIENVTVKVGPALIECSTETSRMASRLMDRPIPDYIANLRYQPKSDFTVHAAVLKEAVGRAREVYRHAATPIKSPESHLVTKAGAVELSMGMPGGEIAVEEIEAEVSTPKALCINPEFLSEMLAEWPEDAQLAVYQEGPGKPIFFSCAKYPAVLHGIAPMAPKRAMAEAA